MESRSMSNAPIAFTLAQWQQAYRDGQSPAELLHALRRELRAPYWEGQERQVS